MPAWKAALYREKAQANYSYFVAGLSDQVCLKSHFRLVKEDRVEVENADFNVPLKEQKKYTRKKNKKNHENRQNEKRMRRNNCFC